MFGFRNRCLRIDLSTLCIGIVSAAVLAFAADTAADLIFTKVRANVVADIADSRGVACMESVERTRYAARRPNRNATCVSFLAATADTPRGALEWRSRLRLDVTAGPAAEEFALTQASRFERDDIGGILQAATAGKGEFITFLRNLIAGEGEPFQSRGSQETPVGRLLAFEFTVPMQKSHFLYASMSGTAAPSSYRGSLFAIPQTSDLKRLTLEADDVGDACRVQYTIDYNSTRVGDREVILPQKSTMEVVNRDGTELRGETYYSGCHRTTTNVTAAAAVSAPKPLPPKVRFRVRFQPPIDNATAATGDPVTAVIRTTVKDKQNGIIVHAGDRLHGRIALIENYLAPLKQWNLAIAFETIERGVGEHGIDQGVEQPVSMVPVDDETMEPAEMQRLRPPGGGFIIFHDPDALADPRFESEWETR